MISETDNKQAQLLSELSDIGFKVDSVAELYNRKLNYRPAIPILLKWLPSMDDMGIKEEIVRALSVKWAKPEAGHVLVNEFQAVPDTKGIGIRWAIGNAIAVVADDDLFEDVCRLVRNKKYGKSREMLVVSLGNMQKTPKAVDVLVELLSDEDLAGYALIALGKLKASSARDRIEEFKKYPKKWIRIEAQRALKEIEKKQ